MIRPAAHQMIGCGYRGILMLIVATVMAISSKAGVGLPPMPPDRTDTNAMAQYRVQVFYQAQKSEQARIRVAQERYDRMLTNRANLLQAMATEYAAREQVVDIPSQSANESGKNTQPDNWLGTGIGVTAIGLCFFGFRFYLNRQSSKAAAGLKY